MATMFDQFDHMKMFSSLRLVCVFCEIQTKMCLLGLWELWREHWDRKILWMHFRWKFIQFSVFRSIKFWESFHCQINIITEQLQRWTNREKWTKWVRKFVQNKHISRKYFNPLRYHSTHFYCLSHESHTRCFLWSFLVVKFHFSLFIVEYSPCNRSQKSIYDAN